MTLILSGTDGLSDVDGSAATPAIRGTDTNTGIFFPAADTIAFSEGGTEAMRIDSSGNVGIGLTTPGAKIDALQELRVSYANANQYRVRLTNTDGNARLFVDGDTSSLIFGTSSAGTGATATERARIDSSGNVGIGTSSPRSIANYVTLGMSGATGSVVDFFTGSTRNGIIVGDNQALTLRTVTALPLVLGTNDTERARIDTSGNLLVGTSSALSNTAKVQISGGSGSTITSETTGTGATDHVNFRNGNGKVGTITTNGTATSYNTSSDYRLKHSVAPMTTGLATVSALKPVTYKWNADDSNGEGFIAHELQEVIPLAVTGEKDVVNEDGSIKPQGVDYSKIVVHLVAAIQELKAINDAQAQTIQSLTARIEALEGK